MTDWEPRMELRNPLDLVNGMDRVLYFSKRGTKTVHDLRSQYLTAKHEYLRAFETAKVELKNQTPKTAQDIIECQARGQNWELFVAMNNAEAEFQYARDKLNDLEKELSKLQTESKLVIKEMEMSR